MRDQNEAATVRLLHGGEPVACRLESNHGRRLTLQLTAEAAAKELVADALVEVLSEQFLYLGVVLGRQKDLLIISVEHAVNRESLASIQEIWHAPQEA